MKKKFSPFLLALVIALALAGCGQSAGNAPAPTAGQTSESAQPSTVPAASSATDSAKTIIFTDSAGRQVDIPAEIQKIAPSGSLAQVVLYTLCPDKIIGWSSKFSDLQKTYLDDKYESLPVFGQFYGKNVNLNIEALIAAKPDVIIDIGEAKPTIKEDMDGIQKQTEIPVIFVEATLDTMAEAYLTLGKLTGETEQAKRLSDYVSGTLADAKAKSATIQAGDRVKVFYGQGDNGLGANAKGSIHADVIDYVGADNVAVMENSPGSGGDEISIEQLMLWNPDVILFGPDSVYGKVASDSLWKDVRAVKDGNFYEVPNGPYNWMGRPPSVNRVLGIKWLGHLLYPKVYDYDMVAEAKKFYKLFYHYELSDDEARALLANSTFK